ncbi:MAG TPA: type VI secretion system contractile sheath small subunit, partial [Gemmataceae bacterium]|nr:type VI secretion system contractile sheath small subunit [Gemmataceae bacterium]
AAEGSLLDQVIGGFAAGGPPRGLAEARDKLRDHLSQVDRSDKLENLLEAILQNPEQLKKLQEELTKTSAGEQAQAKAASPPAAPPAPAGRSQSIHSKLQRVRAPRVDMHYEVHIRGAMVAKELPFVVGVMGDFSGHPTQPLKPLKERKFTQIDRDNFNEVMGKMTPGLNLRVENTLKGDGSELAVQLKFNSMDDFEPAKIAEQVEPLKQLLEARNKLRDLLVKVDRSGQLEQLLEGLLGGPERSGDAARGQDVTQTIQSHIGAADAALSRQLAAILHHPDFRRLEGCWRGLKHLVFNSETNALLKIKVLNISREELKKDLLYSIEFDQSQAFRKIHSAELDMPGGEPYGLLVVDFAFGNHPEDVEMLSGMAQVAEASHCVLAAAAAPRLAGVAGFAGLGRLPDLAAVWASLAFLRWQMLRQQAASGHLMLVAPRVLVRLPYGPATKPIDEFAFEEFPGGAPKREELCWTNAAYMLAEAVTMHFSMHGWFRPLAGQQPSKLETLPKLAWPGGDPAGTSLEWDARPVGNEPGLALLDAAGDFAFFRGTPAVRLAPQGPDPAALPALLGGGRFLHYLHSLLRENAAAHPEPADLEAMLNRWLLNYVNQSPNPGQELLARFPLSAAKVEVRQTDAGALELAARLELRFPGAGTNPVSYTATFCAQAPQ